MRMAIKGTARMAMAALTTLPRRNSNATVPAQASAHVQESSAYPPSR